MGSISIWHWLVVFVVFNVIYIPPLLSILRKAGKSRWWTLLCIIPYFGAVVAFWITAYSPWPALDGASRRPT